MPPADGKWVCPLCLVKMSEPGDRARVKHNREVHGVGQGGFRQRRQSTKGKGAPLPTVGKGRSFNGQDRRVP